MKIPADFFFIKRYNCTFAALEVNILLVIKLYCGTLSYKINQQMQNR